MHLDYKIFLVNKGSLNPMSKNGPLFKGDADTMK